MRHHGRLGFGGAVGLGVAVSLLIAVVVIGRALVHQLTAAVSLVIVFAEVAACVILAGVALAVLGVLVYGGQLGRLKLAERRIGLEVLARGQAVHAEVLNGDDGIALPGPDRPAIGGERPGIYPANVTRLPVGDRGDT
jgi:hypothetical protein